MKRFNKAVLTLILIGTSLLYLGCGATDTGGNYDELGFYLISSLPANGAKLTDLTDPVVLEFSRPVNPQTVATGVRVEKLDASGNPVLYGASATVGINYNYIEIYPANYGWDINAIFQIKLLSTLTALDGSAIRLSADGLPEVKFTTGSSVIPGMISIPGQPYAVTLNVTKVIPGTNDCLGFYLEMNEDMSIFPQAQVEYRWLGITQYTLPLWTWRADAFSYSRFYLVFSADDCGCHPDYWTAGASLKVRAFSGYDLTSEYMIPKDATFTYGSSYF